VTRASRVQPGMPLPKLGLVGQCTISQWPISAVTL
jgi:hypothetical protein